MTSGSGSGELVIASLTEVRAPARSLSVAHQSHVHSSLLPLDNSLHWEPVSSALKADRRILLIKNEERRDKGNLLGRDCPPPPTPSCRYSRSSEREVTPDAGDPEYDVPVSRGPAWRLAVFLRLHIRDE